MKRNTKSALLLSIVSIIVCCTMLLGTTMAWFTDSVTSARNTIIAGNLDVELEYSTDGTEWTKVTSETEIFDDEALWEPGYTQIVYFRVSNVGTLALKYALTAEIYNEIAGVNKEGVEFNLSDYLMYGVLVEDDFEALETRVEAVKRAITTMNGDSIDVSGLLEDLGLGDGWDQLIGSVSTDRSLLPEESITTAMVITMPTTVGNEANHNGTDVPKIEFGIQLLATQLEYEEDSFGPDYDKDATYPTVVSTVEDLTEALANGGNIKLANDIDLDKIALTDAITDDVVIDADGHTITTTDAYGVEVTPGKNITISNAEVEMTKEGDYITYAAGLKIANGDYAGATITLKNCSISMANGDWSYAVNMPAGVKNLNLVIDNCVLEGAVAVQCWGDNNTITITNSELICSYTTNATFTSYCVSLQNDGTNISENNTLVIENCEFSYSGVDNFNKTIYSVEDFGTENNVTVTNCTYGEKVAVYGN